MKTNSNSEILAKALSLVAAFVMLTTVSLAAIVMPSGAAADAGPAVTSVADNDDKPSFLYKAERRYLFGVAIGIADGTTFVTDVCPVDGMDYDSRFSWPLGLELYSNDLREFLTQMGRKGYICSTYCEKSLKGAVKKMVKVRTRLERQKGMQVVDLSEYQYHYIRTSQIHVESTKPAEEEDF